MKKVVIYNPSCIDSIFSAALLQTMGWQSFSSREIVDVEEGQFAWIGVLPTKRNFRYPYNPESRHVCLLKHCRSKKLEHLLIKGVIYGESSLGEEIQGVSDDVVTGLGKRTMLDQITTIENINSPERHYLSYLVSNFYQSKTTIDTIAITVLNAVNALECLNTREPFTPISLDSNGAVSSDLLKAHGLMKSLRKKSERILEHGTLYNHTKTNHGMRRIIRTYESDMWWFLRRHFQPDDIAFNITISAAGAMVDATSSFEYDLGLSDPIIIVS